MNDRKQRVIKMAHQLFVEKGFQATSIQDILEYSGISKGTFYNYFSSKNELLIELLKTIYKKSEQDRNELLIGQDPSNIEVFIEQVKFQLQTSRTNKLISIFEEVNFSNDAELKQFLRKGKLKMLYWLYSRFIDIFGESKQPYLLDCAIMFIGILHHNLKFNEMIHESNNSIHQVVRYSVERIVQVVNEVAETGEQLIQPEVLSYWLPECKNNDHIFQQRVYHHVIALKQALNKCEEQFKYIELLDFVQNEILRSKNPRRFLIESVMQSLKSCKALLEGEEFHELNQLIAAYFDEKN